MTKHLYRIATGLQETLLGAARLHPPDEWPLLVPRVQIDAWATLWRWNAAGEPVHRMTEAEEADILDHPLPASLPLLTAPARAGALAVQLPVRSDWIVIARHAPAPITIPVVGDVCYGFAQPLLTYCTPGSGSGPNSLGSGFVNLLDQPTMADLRLGAGTVTGGQAAKIVPLSDSDLVTDDYRLTLAIAALYRS